MSDARDEKGEPALYCFPSAPPAPTLGDRYLSTIDGWVYGYDGEKWVRGRYFGVPAEMD